MSLFEYSRTSREGIKLTGSPKPYIIQSSYTMFPPRGLCSNLEIRHYIIDTAANQCS